VIFVSFEIYEMTAPEIEKTINAGFLKPKLILHIGQGMDKGVGRLLQLFYRIHIHTWRDI
jgi:hypothetical protein